MSDNSKSGYAIVINKAKADISIDEHMSSNRLRCVPVHLWFFAERLTGERECVSGSEVSVFLILV